MRVDPCQRRELIVVGLHIQLLFVFLGHGACILHCTSPILSHFCKANNPMVAFLFLVIRLVHLICQ